MKKVEEWCYDRAKTMVLAQDNFGVAELISEVTALRGQVRLLQELNKRLRSRLKSWEHCKTPLTKDRSGFTM